MLTRRSISANRLLHRVPKPACYPRPRPVLDAPRGRTVDTCSALHDRKRAMSKSSRAKPSRPDLKTSADKSESEFKMRQRNEFVTTMPPKAVAVVRASFRPRAIRRPLPEGQKRPAASDQTSSKAANAAHCSSLACLTTASPRIRDRELGWSISDRREELDAKATIICALGVGCPRRKDGVASSKG